MALLFAPLAAVPRSERLSSGSVGSVLRSLTAEDSRLVYEAIRLAQPGGLGNVESLDIANEPPADLLAAMRAAADRDLIARQYDEDFRLVFHEALATLAADCTRGCSLTEAIVHTHIFLISRHGDSLIARKGGCELSDRASKIAKQVYLAGNPGDEAYHEALADFDFWLRSDGNRRNPGTTADLVAAALFAGLRDGLLLPPRR
jgi:triphosphoribosyl-dephospho-CoA synthase